METKATWKRVGKAVLAIVLVIALSAGTALFIHRRSGVSAAATVKNGLSAYELAVADGYSGTMQEWLASLRGQSAYALAKEAGYTGSESDWAARLAKLAQSDPVSLTAANFNDRGQLILTLSDGTTLNLGNAVGENGKNGSDGRNGTDGKNGVDGKDGKDGVNGVSVSGVDLTDAGELVLRFSDDRMVNVGRVTGAQGIQGEKGEKGDTGAQGTQGEKGEKGDTGAQGIQGEKGEKGDTGAQGAQGEKGEKGDTGAQGAQGEKGEKGDTGAQGIQGEKGEKGDTGAQGAQGEKGEKGDTGVSVTGVTLEDYKLVVTLSDGTVLRLEQSLLGATGAKGDTGAQGAQGEKGEKGDTGAAGRGIDRVVLTADGCLIFEYTDGTKSEPTASLVGAQGAQGEKGEKGDTGADGRGIVTVSLDGGDLYVTYSDSATPVRIGTVRGEKGDKGDPGAQGEKGDPGVDGKSAYELYKAAYPYYTGTLTEWLASLKGDTGRGIAKTEIIDGYLWVTYTDNSKENAGPIASEEDNSELIFVELPDGTYGVKAGGKAKDKSTITIPETYNGKSITQICADGFKGLTTIQKIVLPDSIIIIGNNAFDGCVGLNDIVFPENLELINQYAFNNCTSLTSITIPAAVKLIGKYAFCNSGLTSATLKSTSGWKTGEISIKKTGYGKSYSTMTDFRIEQKEGEWYMYSDFSYPLSDSEKAATALSKKVENATWVIMSYGGSTQYAYVTFEAYNCDWTHD